MNPELAETLRLLLIGFVCAQGGLSSGLLLRIFLDANRRSGGQGRGSDDVGDFA
jgi:hypothetical protein